MALDDFSTSLNVVNKIYWGTSTPPASSTSCTFQQGDIYFRRDVTAGSPAIYFYTGSAWKGGGNIAS